MPRPETNIPAAEEIEPYSTAFFFDFDGTLAEIAATPDAVELPAQSRRDLEIIASATGGALAVVSGRPIDELDRFLRPFSPPLAGVHGLEYRDIDGRHERADFDAKTLDTLQTTIKDFAARHDGLIAEPKPGSIALHYRSRPELEAECVALGRSLAADLDGVTFMHGKKVVELRVGGRSKADAVTHFMAMPPFAGRTPVFIGDDVTDEDGFRGVAELGGHGIKIGSGETAAQWRVADIFALRGWLRELARICERAVPDGGPNGIQAGGQTTRVEPARPPGGASPPERRSSSIHPSGARAQ